ncbi:MAG TPA: phosphotransferase family protein [Bacillales bacterium]|nr:phosphotransferase family protein [Bacillales bacterium]
MQQLYLGDDWDIEPAGGQTGEAFFAKSGEQKLFLKRNSSPFLAVLSAEGIVPRLLWTKRLENGDVVTAQRWLKGRVLSKNEMKSHEVAELLRKIHRSDALLGMLKRLGKQALTPNALLERIVKRRKAIPFVSGIVEDAVSVLQHSVSRISFAHRAVCHSDIHHNNWLLNEEGDLYLIDWDNAVEADPVLDLSMLLYQYVEKKDWRKWLKSYGMMSTPDLQLRLHWYTTAQVLLYLLWYRKRGEMRQAERLEHELVQLNQEAFLLNLTGS